MTRKEAIEALKSFPYLCDSGETMINACEIAVEVLENESAVIDRIIEIIKKNYNSFCGGRDFAYKQILNDILIEVKELKES